MTAKFQILLLKECMLKGKLLVEPNIKDFINHKAIILLMLTCST